MFKCNKTVEVNYHLNQKVKSCGAHCVAIVKPLRRLPTSYNAMPRLHPTSAFNPPSC